MSISEIVDTDIVQNDEFKYGDLSCTCHSSFDIAASIYIVNIARYKGYEL